MGGKQSKARQSAEILGQIANNAEYEELKGFDFGYENIALEGGGIKGIGYIGMAKALEDLGILQKCKRFSGASMGAMVAAKLALGGGSKELLEDFLVDSEKMSSDGTAFDILRGIVEDFGWHPGKRLYKYFRKVCEEATGNPDITFKQLYDMRGVELCMTVTNLSSLRVEYFHPKTTPDVPLALAARMSISIPVLYRPIKTYRDPDCPIYMVDGGIMNNFPINAYDGWFLSLAPQHTFFHMIGTDEPEFGTYNDKTLGAVLFDAFENEYDEDIYYTRRGFKNPVRPKTKLVKKKGAEVEKILSAKQEKAKMLNACKQFISLMSENDLDRNGKISLQEFHKAIQACPKDVLQTLFSQDHLSDGLFKNIDKDGSGEITYPEFMNFMQHKGVPLRHHMISPYERKIHGLRDFLLALINAHLVRIRSLIKKEGDADRTVSIYMDYIGTVDFKLQKEDKVFGAKQGWDATIAFLKERKRKMLEGGHGGASGDSETACNRL